MHDVTTQMLRAGLAGDAGQMDGFICRLTPLLLAAARRCARSLRDRGVSPEDLVQDVWLRSLPRIAGLQHDGERTTPKVVAYLTTAIRRRTRDLMLKLATRRQVTVGDGTPPDIAAETIGVVTRAVRHEQDDGVLAAIESLDQNDRDALILLSIEQVSVDEAASTLSISPEAVRQRHKRARDRLRDRLRGSAFDDLPEPV